MSHFSQRSVSRSVSGQYPVSIRSVSGQNPFSSQYIRVLKVSRHGPATPSASRRALSVSAPTENSRPQQETQDFRRHLRSTPGDRTSSQAVAGYSCVSGSQTNMLSTSPSLSHLASSQAFVHRTSSTCKLIDLTSC